MSEHITLTIYDQVLLAQWGCENYLHTIERLQILNAVTEDQELGNQIHQLADKLLRCNAIDDYPRIIAQSKANVESIATTMHQRFLDMHSRVESAMELPINGWCYTLLWLTDSAPATYSICYDNWADGFFNSQEPDEDEPDEYEIERDD